MSPRIAWQLVAQAHRPRSESSSADQNARLWGTVEYCAQELTPTLFAQLLLQGPEQNSQRSACPRPHPRSCLSLLVPTSLGPDPPSGQNNVASCSNGRAPLGLEQRHPTRGSAL